MKRAVFLAAAGAMALPPLAALAAASTIVVVNCSVADLSDDAEDFLAGALRERHVTALDPSAVDVTYHRRARLQAIGLAGAADVDYSEIAWVSVRYHARRLLAVNARLTHTSLPYGDFTAYNVRARCSYRCFDVVSKEIVAAGSGLGTGRGEDLDQAQDSALHEGLLAVARSAAPKLA